MLLTCARVSVAVLPECYHRPGCGARKGRWLLRLFHEDTELSPLHETVEKDESSGISFLHLNFAHRSRSLHWFALGDPDIEWSDDFCAWTQARQDLNTLNTYDKRRMALYDHSFWNARSPTPFISLSSTSEAIWRIYKKMMKKGDSMDDLFLSIIDADALCQADTPLIAAKEEMKAHGVKDPYGKEYKYYEDEVLALYAIPPKCIVKTLPWWAVRTVVKHGEDILRSWDKLEGMQLEILSTSKDMYRVRTSQRGGDQKQ